MTKKPFTPVPSIQIKQNFDLSHDNTMALSCTADQAIILEHENQIDTIFSTSSSKHTNNHTKIHIEDDRNILILSGGSNIILPHHLTALVIMPRYTGIEILDENDQHIYIEVMAGNNWHDLVVECTQQGWYGLENLTLIPGLVGASPVQNIGAYGVQLEDCLTHVRSFNLKQRQWHTLAKSDCQFSYRDSLFKQQANTWLISRVGFKLHKNPHNVTTNYGDVATQADTIAKKQGRGKANPHDVMQAIINIRQSKLPDPAKLANTGSFFQNPIIPTSHYNKLLTHYPTLPKYDIDDNHVKVPAGWLIDQAGLKGKGIAPILTHNQQALVLTNHAPYQATQQDIANTRDLIINIIAEAFAIHLKPEPVWITSNA